MVKRIAVDLAKPGQVLAEQIARQDGVLLASQGSEVSDALIRMLQRQNIDSIAIEEDEGRTFEEIQAAYQADVTRMNEAFIRVEADPILHALKKTLIFMSMQERDKALAYLELSESPSPEAKDSDSEEAKEEEPFAKEVTLNSQKRGKGK
ncbi:MAG: hypothetical protein LBE38_00375 [Deltaproteobacteria bacterium]|nr:hypothetical protein [Deltaproteobacteria bacterium]